MYLALEKIANKLPSNKRIHLIQTGWFATDFIESAYKEEAKKINTQLLGELPLDLDTRVASDSGVPIVVSHPKNPTSIAFFEVAEKLCNFDI